MAVIFLSPIGFVFYQHSRKAQKEKRTAELSAQFRECILCVGANLRAGYSAENAFSLSCGDMEILFGRTSYIVEELMWIKKGLRNNINLEELLEDFGKRSGVDEIREFAEVFMIVKRNGGDLPEVISDTAVILSDRLELKKEIKVLISGRQFEQKIMSIIPFAIVFYIELTTPGYFDILYRNFPGTVIMSFCLILYLAANFAAERMIENGLAGV